MGIVLASGSPRRKELLEMLGIKELRVIPAQGEEARVAGRRPEETVRELSRAKAREVAALCDGEDIIIAADTIVWMDGRIFGKPSGKAEAIYMLRALSGREHTVYSGVTVIRGERELVAAEKTGVRFRELTDREITAYVETGEPLDKAGAYGAQGLGGLLVEGIVGDFFNVMGLPICRLGRMLNELGVELL